MDQSTSAADADATADATADAEAAAARAGVTVKALHDISDLAAAVRIFDDTWPLPGGGTTLELNFARALEHAGSYLGAAFDAQGRPVGAALAFLGRHRDDDGSWDLHLHSHMAAVVPQWRDRHVGTALKLHQRAWSLQHGVHVIAWTFDPLVRRNARLNLSKLGAGVSEYLPDFYGDMTDGINAGDRSDRLMAWWQVGSARVAAAARGGLPPYAEVPEGALVVPLPDDVVALRAHDPAAALHWRLQVRAALMTALADGYRIDGVTTEGGYVLLPPGHPDRPEEQA